VTAVYAQQGDTPPQPVEVVEIPPVELPPAKAPPSERWSQDGSYPDSEQLTHDRRHPRGLRGEVTALHEAGFSLLTRNELVFEANVHSGTKIWLVATQSQGTLEEIQVGDDVLVQGCRCGESSVGAWRVVVGPAGDEVHGWVTAIEGTTLQLENKEGTVTVLTDDATEFRLGREAATLEDVTEGAFLAAFGQLQSEGSLNAELVILHPPHEPPIRNVRGDVTAVSSTGLTMSVQRPRVGDADQAPISVQVNVTDETKIWLVETERQGSLADVEVGDKVVVRGMRAQGSTEDAPMMDAKQIAVSPDGDEVHGLVTSVDGTMLTLRIREGQVTVHTDENTSYRFVRAAAAGKQPASLQEITRGTAIVAFGKLQADGSLDADQVFIQRRPPRRSGAGPEDGTDKPQGGFDLQPPTGQSSAPLPDARYSAQQS
jgi:hypothetical protein